MDLFMRCACALLSTVLASSLASAAPEDRVEPIMFPDDGPWGLVIHTSGHAEPLKRIGVQWVRVGIRWSEVEKEQGVYDWSEADKLVQFYLDNDFRVLAILTLEAISPAYESQKDNRPVVIDAITKWCEAAALRYKGKGIVWEISNEPVVFPMGDYWNNPVTYTVMARRVALKIKQADPEARVAALSAAWMDRQYIDRSLNAGLLNDKTIDLITFHGYHRANIMPESALAEDVTWLRNVVRRHAKGKEIIVVDSERGYYIHPPGSPKSWGMWRNITYSETEQAAYLARHCLEEYWLGLEMIVWYKDMYGEENCSLYYGDGSTPETGLRPMGHVYRNLALLMPENPKKLRNDEYSVSLTDLPDMIPSPDGTVRVRTFLRSYLQDNQKRQRLIVAAWNPVEAFNGKILQSREQVGGQFIETWRDVTPSDVVDVMASVQVTGLAGRKIVGVSTYDLLAKETADAHQPMEYVLNDGVFLTHVMNIGPMPKVVVIDLEPTATEPTEGE